jgi:hypothetical protein
LSVEEVVMYASNAATVFESQVVSHTVRVPNRFNGPPSSGNGRWTAALLGKHVGREVEVTLKRPVPMDRDLEVLCVDGEASLRDTGDEIACARRAELDLDIPEGVGFARAAEARASFAGYRNHPFPGCFVCGTGRCCGDGMCLFTGPIGTGIVASSWVPEAEFVTPDGTIAPELILAALDCPGAWGLIDRYGITGPFVLGRIQYQVRRPVYAGERYVVQGWALGRERRKSFCGTAVYDAEGTVCAAAAATWIELR